eukprot:TRINITY_DN136436_c0_g1_i1.p1 TRINITY_DN136436_c0_g1~~TRINITY_DN136436_c0_g1_i1.p1  ORF type:complete len:153 (-),score=45.15 TRINITY_DN136436_c0_g1_i1:22-480(-)
MTDYKIFTCKDDGTPCSCSELVTGENFKKGPKKVTIAADDNESQWICQCGQSKSFPFCDGSHDQYNAEHKTDIQPLELKKAENEVGKEKTAWVCSCGHSKSRPFCDGTHNKLYEKKETKKEEPKKKEEPVSLTWPWVLATAVILGSFFYKYK